MEGRCFKGTYFKTYLYIYIYITKIMLYIIFFVICVNWPLYIIIKTVVKKNKHKKCLFIWEKYAWPYYIIAPSVRYKQANV